MEKCLNGEEESSNRKPGAMAGNGFIETEEAEVGPSMEGPCPLSLSVSYSLHHLLGVP